MACFWACGPLCLQMHSPAPSLTLSPPGHCSNIREIGSEQRGKNINQFPNNTFLSTTQTHQGQNEWQCQHFVKVKVPESFAESREASCEGSPCPQPRTKWAPSVGLIQTESDGQVQSAAVTAWYQHVLVSWSLSS